MDQHYKIDTNTRWGADWFKRWIVRRLVYFCGGTWVGLVVGLYPFWRQMPEGFGRWGYAFWWALVLGVPAGFSSTFFNGGGSLQSNQRAGTGEGRQQPQKRPRRQSNGRQKSQPDKPKKPNCAKKCSSSSPACTGESTGMLHARGHVGGVPQGTYAEISGEDASKNIIIFGGTGGGKTSRSINPLLRQLMMQNAGALIF